MLRLNNCQILFICLLLSFSFLRTTSTEILDAIQISPILHEQALSHLAFHSDPLKLALANLFAPPKTVAIVGVEWAEDVVLFAYHGFHVYAFEPVQKFVANLQDLKNQNEHWNITIVPYAATNQSGDSMHLEYDNEQVNEDVETVLVDDFVDERLTVFSLDVQGAELSALQGSRRLLEKGVIDSIWVEAIACNGDVQGVLEMLEGEYVVFDFVPWGKAKGEADDSVPRSLASFAFEPQRPSSFKNYLEWMCREKEKAYEWLQTDFLAVKKELVVPKLLSSLRGLADSVCTDSGGADCLLRKLALSHDADKDEL